MSEAARGIALDLIRMIHKADKASDRERALATLAQYADKCEADLPEPVPTGEPAWCPTCGSGERGWRNEGRPYAPPPEVLRSVRSCTNPWHGAGEEGSTG